MKLTAIVIVAIVIGLLVAIEIGLRSLFGFGNPLIYVGDEQIGYLLAPNQRTRRFGNRIEINEYSMRSRPIQQTPAPSTRRVLILGDSIANGGWWTDQDNTIAYLMMRSLAASIEEGRRREAEGRRKDSTLTEREQLEEIGLLDSCSLPREELEGIPSASCPLPSALFDNSKYQKVEVLNASANSWGPRNELAYLQRFGNFQAQTVVLLINTDDLFATAPTSLPVGRDRNYPDRQPPLALLEVWQRYLTKQKPIPELQAVQNEPGDRVGVNLEAIGKIQALTRESNSQFLLVMTPLLREIGEPGPRDYEIKARQRLSNFAQAQQITYIDVLPIFNSTPNVKAFYQDHIHLNLQGNQLVSQLIERSLGEKFLIPNS